MLFFRSAFVLTALAAVSSAAPTAGGPLDVILGIVKNLPGGNIVGKPALQDIHIQGAPLVPRNPGGPLDSVTGILKNLPVGNVVGNPAPARHNVDLQDAPLIPRNTGGPLDSVTGILGGLPGGNILGNPAPPPPARRNDHIQGAPLAPRNPGGPLDTVTGIVKNLPGGNVVGNPALQNIHIQGAPLVPRNPGGPLDSVTGVLKNLPGGNIINPDLTNAVHSPALTPTQTRRDEVQSLPQILNGVEAKLAATAAHLRDVSAGKSEVDAEILVGIVGDVETILRAGLDSAKLLVGQPTDAILTLDGKVLTVSDVGRLLLTVVSIICTILSCVMKVVASASVEDVTPAITEVGNVLVELLHCVFDLVLGLVVALTPYLGPVVSAFTNLKLDVVVKALRGQ